MIDDALKTKLVAALKTSKKPFHVRDCSICNYPLSFFAKGDQLYCDLGCNCSSLGPQPPEARDWGQLDFYCDAKNGHIVKVEQFIAATLQTKKL